MKNRYMYKTPDGYTVLINKNDLKGRCLEDHERYIPQGENRCACCELIFKNGLLTSWENAYGDFDKLCPDCYNLIINDKNLNIRG